MSNKSKNVSMRRKAFDKKISLSKRNVSSRNTQTLLPSIKDSSYEELFFKINNLRDIVQLKEKGDIYKGVISTSGETRIVARITGKAFSFPVTICSSSADRKIKEAYNKLKRQSA